MSHAVSVFVLDVTRFCVIFQLLSPPPPPLSLFCLTDPFYSVDQARHQVPVQHKLKVSPLRMQAYERFLLFNLEQGQNIALPATPTTNNGAFLSYTTPAFS